MHIDLCESQEKEAERTSALGCSPFDNGSHPSGLTKPCHYGTTCIFLSLMRCRTWVLVVQANKVMHVVGKGLNSLNCCEMNHLKWPEKTKSLRVLRVAHEVENGEISSVRKQLKISLEVSLSCRQIGLRCYKWIRKNLFTLESLQKSTQSVDIVSWITTFHQ